MKKNVALILVLSMVLTLCGCDSNDYRKAKELFAQGDYDEAKTIFERLGDYEDSQSYAEKCEIEERYAEKDTVSKQDFMASCTKIDDEVFEELLRYPEKYIGSHVCFEGWVISEPEEYYSEIVADGRVRDLSSRYTTYKLNISFREDTNEGRLIKSDKVCMWGIFEGLTPFHSLGGTYGNPTITVYYYKMGW